MPRQPRQHSATGIYHVMLRGVNRQRLFEDNDDYQHFLDCLAHAQRHSGVTLFAYVMMSNHVHLLVEEGWESVSVTVKRLAVRYAGWFNRKYDRVGHLFQDRFVSKVVDDDGYFLMVLLYIHLNPVVAGLCARPDQYAWSSRRTFGHPGCLVDMDRLEEIVPMEAVIRGEAQPEAVGSMDVMAYEEETGRLTDAQVWDVVAERSGVATGSDFQRLPKERQRDVVRLLRSRQVPIRQISRVTGVNRNLVFRWGSM